MQVIGHDAISVNNETFASGGVQQSRGEPVTNGFVRKNRSSFSTTEGDEIDLLTKIAGFRQANPLAMEWHGKRLAQGENVWRAKGESENRKRRCRSEERRYEMPKQEEALKGAATSEFEARAGGEKVEIGFRWGGRSSGEMPFGGGK